MVWLSKSRHILDSQDISFQPILHLWLFHFVTTMFKLPVILFIIKMYARNNISKHFVNKMQMSTRLLNVTYSFIIKSSIFSVETQGTQETQELNFKIKG